MFFEKCGRFFFLKMRPSFFFLLILIPFFIVIWIMLEKMNETEMLEARFSAALKKESIATERKAQKEKFLNRYSNPNPYFLNEKVEILPLLQHEQRKWISFLNHPAFPKSEAIQNRLDFLKMNKIAFAEEKIETSSLMKETEETLRKPIQVDTSDLKMILSILEDVKIDSIHYFEGKNMPQILIKDFHLRKVETPLENEVFEVEMDLIKREFTQ